jgi:hypothetical protein
MSAAIAAVPVPLFLVATLVVIALAKLQKNEQRELVAFDSDPVLPVDSQLRPQSLAGASFAVLFAALLDPQEEALTSSEPPPQPADFSHRSSAT